MWIIQNGKWFLSNQYEKVAEEILGYGGVYTEDFNKAKVFKKKKDAIEELKRAKRANPWVELKELN